MKSTCHLNRCNSSDRGGLAAVELMMALGLLFTAAWTFFQLGVATYEALLQLVSPLILWPLG